MSVPVCNTPPDARTSYIIDQLEGERISIPGSKGVFRILASSKQTNGGIAVFSSGAVLSDAPGFHWHEEAHDVFLVTKGFLKLWNGDKCRVMGPGDFAYVPPVRREFTLPPRSVTPRALTMFAAESNPQPGTPRPSLRNARLGSSGRLGRLLPLRR